MKPSEHRCWKCAHLVMAGEYAICNYFENTGKLRTYPEGKDGPRNRFSATEPCQFYKRAKRGLNTVPPLPELFDEKKNAEAERVDLRKGVRCGFDYEKARKMYLAGAPIGEIAETVGTDKHNISKYASRYGWRLDPACVTRDKRGCTETENKNRKEKK